MSGIRALWACLAAVSWAAQVQAQETDPWQRKNDRGNRYEGILQIPARAPLLELRSFVATVEAFGSGAQLHVRFFLPAREQVMIFAQELEDRRHYWMESKPRDWSAGQWNEFAPWFTSSVLDVEKVPHDNLGVVVKAGSGVDPLFLPAYVYHSSPPRAASAYRFYFKSRSTLRSVAWSLFVDGDRKVRTEQLAGERLPGEVFALDLPAEGLPQSVLRLVIEATRPGTGRGRIWDGRLFPPPAH